MTYRFTKSVNDFNIELYNNVIKYIFPNLNKYDSELLLKYLLRTIDIISYCFNFSFEREKANIFIDKLKNDNYKDAIGIMYLLLPFINSESDKSKIISFEDIYIDKTKNTDININEPKYVFSNLQYGRCIRSNPIKEIKFNEEHLKQNFYLLVDTIRLCSKKLYVNWINVFPYTIEEVEILRGISYITFSEIIYAVNTFKPHREFKYYDYMLLKETGTLIDATSLDKDDDEVLRKHLTPLQIDDIYEIITNFLYYEVKNIKWLIFDVYANKSIIPISIFLKLYFGKIIDYANNSINWIDINNTEKNDFENNWNNLINSSANPGISVDQDELKKVLRAIIIFFDNYYKGKEQLIRKKKYISFNKGKDVNDEEENIFIISYSDILRSANSVKAEYIYDFIKESLELFNNTFYSYFVTNDNSRELEIKTIDEFYKGYRYRHIQDWKIKNPGVPTLKNIYNYAKSFCHITINDEYRELPRYWRSLTMELKRIILHRIGEENNFLAWFNIKKNIRNTYSKIIRNMDVNNINLQIYRVINKNIPDIAYDVLLYKGLLSKVDLELKSLENEDIIKRLERLNTENNYDHYKYYLTNRSYNYHYTVVQNERTKDTQYINYMQFNLNKHFERPYKQNIWYKAYALDWISQINFFHKYLNNRIIYVTGSTGVGKSTQVPKLLMYALKSLNYNELGKIVCTQPRTTPTKNNALQVSKELGVPMEKPDKTNIVRDNYYVQYKYRGANKTKNVNHLSLKFVTDGSLSMEMTNPLLKKTIRDNNNIINTYIPDNIYDIVAVDEAHEHNANMDLILTYMRHVAHYNNSIKLVIISATMEDDEPVYRRYYRDVNDNRMYPLNNELKMKQLDRINIDRRLHISPPGQTTRYTIDEYYIEDHLISDPVQIAMDIIRKDPRGGDILLFRPGVSEILKDLERLNSILPSDTIALPYYSQLVDTKKKLIEKIDSLKHLIKMDKHSDFNLVDPLVGNNRYRRVIIIATNIAEASITIGTLKYVIETGRQKTSRYNYKKRSSVLTEGSISESSRLQRKGRVGRVGPGTVYYTYNKGTMENNKTQFNIAVQEISSDLYRRLYESSNNKILLNVDNDPNNPRLLLNINMLPTKYSFGIDAIILKQYFILNNYFDYFGDKTQYDYGNYQPLAPYYTTGFDIKTLTDNNGSFYIVHPEELNIRRNITGKITGLMENAPHNDINYHNGNIESEKINSFWDTMFNNLYLMKNMNETFKTQFGKDLQKLQELMEFDDQKLFIAYIYSRAYDIEESMIKFISFIRAVGKFSDNFIVTKNINGRYMRQIDKVKQLVGEQSSDIESILKILDDIHSIININLDINKSLTFKSKNIYNLYRNFDNIRNAINDTQNGREIMYNINNYDYDELIDLLYLNKIPSIIYKNLIRLFYSNSIRVYCNNINIKYETILTYFDNYFDLKNTIYNINNNIYEDNHETVNIKRTIDLIKDNIIDKTLLNNKDKLSACLLMAYPYNIVKKIRRTPYYLSINYPSLENVYNISLVGRSKIEDTLIDNMYKVQYLLYINLDIEKNSISVLHYINPKLFSTISHIYNPVKINALYYKHKTNIFKNQPINNITTDVLTNFRETLDEIHNDINIYFNNKMNLNINDMENKFKHYKN